jgi:exopolyphosphatase/guanosine-5'-triphosphate,3'-diphosphate pyrophosphatase
MKPIRVGIIDIGSNSIKLQIAEGSSGTEIRPVHFEVEEVRIGEGMTKNPPIIESDAIKVGTQAVARLHSIASQYELHQLSIVATSAVRDAHNRHEFVDSIRAATGMELRTLSGAEEANLIGKGIMQDPGLVSLNDFTLADLGGGSLECIQFRNQVTVASQSFNLGAVRLASQFLQNRKKPVSLPKQENIEKAVRSALQSSSIHPDPEITTAILTGGTASILSQLAPESGTNKKIDLVTARSIRDRVCEMDFDRRVADFAVPAKRADIFPTATIILCELIQFLGCRTIYFSFFNLRFGLAAEMIETRRSANL